MSSITSIDAYIQIMEILDVAVTKQKECSGIPEALELMYTTLTVEVQPVLYSLIDKATKYRRIRDVQNIKLNKIMNDTVDKLEELFIDDDSVDIMVMSSIGAQLNLIHDSDIDIGCIVNGLNIGDEIDLVKYDRVVKLLEKLGFTYSHTFNADKPHNRYYSYINTIDGVEIEVKIRDRECSKAVLDLHNFLDTKLTEDQITLFTYAKFILKTYDRKYYTIFKKMLYEAGFSQVGGTFLL